MSRLCTSCAGVSKKKDMHDGGEYECDYCTVYKQWLRINWDNLPMRLEDCLKNGKPSTSDVLATKLMKTLEDMKGSLERIESILSGCLVDKENEEGTEDGP